MPGARGVLGVVFIATLLMSLSSNMLNIAVPALTAHFHASAGQSSLVVVAYQLVNTMLLIPMGQVADAANRRRTFLAALGLYAVVSLLMGLSPDIGWVAGGRALQGAASALLLSNAVAILAAVFPADRLAGAMGVYLSGFSIGQVLGPLVGGAIVSTIGWRWLFWGLVPVALAAVAWGMSALRVVPVGEPRKAHLDLPGGLLLALVVGGSQLALTLGAQVGLGDRRVLSALAGCLLLLPLLALVERRLSRPVLAPELFRSRDFPLALLHGFLVTMPRIGAMTVAGLYFQGVMGDPAAVSALKILGFPLGLTLGSLVGGRVGRRIGHRAALTTSAAMSAVGMGLLAADVHLASGWGTMVALALVGLGNGVFQTENSSMIILSTPRERTGVVNSIRVMTQSFGAGIGLALAMALVVAFVPGEVARTFLSGDAAGVGADRAGLDAGFFLTYGTFFVLMALGAVLTLVRPRQPAADGRIYARSGRNLDPPRRSAAHLSMANIDDFNPLDPSEVTDQLDPEQSLVERGVADPLDEGIIAPEDWSGAMHEALDQPEGLRQRLKQEDPGREPYEEPNWDGEGLDETEYRRAGRLVDANGGFDQEDRESTLVGRDVGISGGAASAEEAAVQVVDEDDLIEAEGRDD